MRRFGKRCLLGVCSISLSLHALVACGGAEPCVSSALCGRGEVCTAKGACAPLAREAGRFSRGEWLPAQDWGATAGGGDAPGTDTDLLLLGGARDHQIYLSFGPLPEGSAIARAIVVLSPHETWTPPAGGARIAAFAVRPFRGDDLNRRDAPRREHEPIAEVALASGMTRRLRLDITPQVERAHRRGAEIVSIAVVGEVDGADDLPLRLASPWALDAERRPRLELSVR